jgi:glutamate 5-kinase
MFTDNDELSGLIARLMHADTLILLSNIDGLYNGRPGDEGVALIPVVEAGHDVSEYIQTEKSGVGRGGMQSKCKTAIDVAASGIDVLLARGTRENVLVDLLDKAMEVPHTHFRAVRGERLAVSGDSIASI